MITFSSSCLAIFDLVGCCTVISWQLMIFIVISLWVWSSLIGGCGFPLILVSESWSLCLRNATQVKRTSQGFIGQAERTRGTK